MNVNGAYIGGSSPARAGGPLLLLHKRSQRTLRASQPGRPRPMATIGDGQYIAPMTGSVTREGEWFEVAGSSLSARTIELRCSCGMFG